MRFTTFVPTFLVVLLLTPAAISQEEAGLQHTTNDGRLAPMLEGLGDLHVPVTTSSREAQQYFDQGMRLIYAFNHAEALRSFREAARQDDQCAMTYWGQALALAPNINDSAIGPDREQQGFAAIREAVKRRSSASEKEQALIDALEERFATKVPEGDRASLNSDYAKAMNTADSRTIPMSPCCTPMRP